MDGGTGEDRSVRSISPIRGLEASAPERRKR